MFAFNKTILAACAFVAMSLHGIHAEQQATEATEAAQLFVGGSYSTGRAAMVGGGAAMVGGANMVGGAGMIGGAGMYGGGMYSGGMYGGGMVGGAMVRGGMVGGGMWRAAFHSVAQMVGDSTRCGLCRVCDSQRQPVWCLCMSK